MVKEGAIILDPVIGIVKGILGIKDRRIAGIGKAGNPFLMDDFNNNLIISACTEVTGGEHSICTPGHLDTPCTYDITPAICQSNQWWNL